MKVYIVLEDAGSEGYYYRGVFKTREEAESHMKSLQVIPKYAEDYSVNEVEL